MNSAHLVDTNIHLRLLRSSDPQHELARGAINELIGRDFELVVALQNLIEFWAVATRPPSARGGIGLSREQAMIEVLQISEIFGCFQTLTRLFSNGMSWFNIRVP